MSGPKPKPPIDRIFNLLAWRGECLLWLGSVNNMGYGMISRIDPGTRLVHRVVAGEHGEVCDDQVVLHSCDTPACCNPEHLVVGTQSDNIHDCIDKGRFKPRELLTHCKRDHEFTPENTRTQGKVRHCRECGRIRMREYRARKVLSTL